MININTTLTRKLKVFAKHGLDTPMSIPFRTLVDKGIIQVRSIPTI